MHPKLSHLTAEQCNELLEKYYDSEKTLSVTEIIEEYNIDVRAGELISLFPLKTHQETCIHCEDMNLVSRLPSRSSTSSTELYCPNCDHKYNGYCRCKKCIQTANDRYVQAELLKRELIYESYGVDEFTPTDVSELSLKSLIYLKGSIIHFTSENYEYVKPFVSTEVNLAPTFQYQDNIVRNLYRNRLISPCPDSDLGAFAFDDDGELKGHYPTKVDWLLLPNLNTAERLNFIGALDRELKEYSESSNTQDQDLEIWHEIVKNEALEYFEHKLSGVNIRLNNIGEKTHKVFDDLCNRFSVAQIYQLIFTTVRDTNHFGIEKSIPKYQLKNMFVGNLEKKANKYEAEGWMKDYRRDFDCPQSTLSSLFFDSYLKVGGGYFTTPIPL